MKTTVAIIALTLKAATSVFAWGHVGHSAIADVALDSVTAATKTKVMAILNNTMLIPEVNSMSNAARWPDDIKNFGVLHDSTAGQGFTTRFGDHAEWHFVNYPLEGQTYTASGVFSATNDIVHRINLCIDVLEGNSTVMNDKEALCYLVHLVGDIHQPLHVACGYYTLKKKMIKLDKTPNKPHSYCSDTGGNGLKLNGTSVKFHAFWDDNLVSANATAEPKLVTLLEANTLTFSPNNGPIRNWAAHWADDSIALADSVYNDLQSLGAFQGVTGTKGKDKYDPKQPTVTADINLDESAFRTDHKKDAEDQMTKAAHNLADLLNNIQWQ